MVSRVKRKRGKFKNAVAFGKPQKTNIVKKTERRNKFIPVQKGK